MPYLLIEDNKPRKIGAKRLMTLEATSAVERIMEEVRPISRLFPSFPDQEIRRAEGVISAILDSHLIEPTQCGWVEGDNVLRIYSTKHSVYLRLNSKECRLELSLGREERLYFVKQGERHSVCLCPIDCSGVPTDGSPFAPDYYRWLLNALYKANADVCVEVNKRGQPKRRTDKLHRRSITILPPSDFYPFSPDLVGGRFSKFRMNGLVDEMGVNEWIRLAGSKKILPVLSIVTAWKK